MRLTILLLLLPILGTAQVTTCVSIENEIGDATAGTYTFDVYVSTAAGSVSDLYMATSDVQIRFSTAAFTSPTLSKMDNPSPPSGIQNGFCTFIPTSTDNGGITDLLAQFGYHGAISTSISGSLASINLNTISVSSSNILTGIAKIDGTRSTHRLGRFVISGYTGGSPGLVLETLGVLPTLVYTYATATPFSATVTSLIGCTSLPVEWLGFEATVQNQNVNLDWSTGKEYNTALFQIERKSGDGNFESIGTITPTGLEENQYHFLDTEAPLGKLRYRIRQIDINGNSQLSSVVNVLLSSEAQVWLYPNPSEGNIQILFSEESDAVGNLKIFGLDGKLLLERELRQEGSKPVEMSIKELPAGSYGYQIIRGAQSFGGVISKY
ncbi:MAG: T9SS type A sorting domain-containing protein [Bacteroidia bacterium]